MWEYVLLVVQIGARNFKGFHWMWQRLVGKKKLLRRAFGIEILVAAGDHEMQQMAHESVPVSRGMLLSVMSDSACIDRLLTEEYTVFAGTWNVGGIPPPEDLNLEEWLDTSDGSYDIYVLGFQEVVPLSAGNVLRTENPSICTKWNRLIRSALNEKTPTSNVPILLPQEQQQQKQRIHPVIKEKAAGEYQCIASKQMVGIMISVWVKRTLLKFIRNPSVSCVGCGLMGCLGNKGSVSVRFLLRGTSFCFVCSHLPSGGKKGDEIQRNWGVYQIISRTRFTAGPSMDLPTNILSHERVIWLGDLNYRISLPELETRSLVERQEWRILHENDQLRIELCEGGAFHGWHEGIIEFAPTYKYYHGSDEYYGSDQHSGNRKKKRAPAWCDRILWYGKGIKQNMYERREMRHSDHRPVRATFTITTDILDSIKTSKNLIFSSARYEMKERSVVGNGN